MQLDFSSICLWRSIQDWDSKFSALHLAQTGLCCSNGRKATNALVNMLSGNRSKPQPETRPYPTICTEYRTSVHENTVYPGVVSKTIAVKAVRPLEPDTCTANGAPSEKARHLGQHRATDLCMTLGVSPPQKFELSGM